MPNNDRTGPEGQGPMTGRGLGSCGNGQGMRRGFGRGCGRGLGRARCPTKFLAGFSKEEEKKILEAQLNEIETEKQEITKRLKEI
jgi:hypothetical protein